MENVLNFCVSDLELVKVKLGSPLQEGLGPLTEDWTIKTKFAQSENRASF